MFQASFNTTIFNTFCFHFKSPYTPEKDNQAKGLNCKPIKLFALYNVLLLAC